MLRDKSNVVIVMYVAVIVTALFFFTLSHLPFMNDDKKLGNLINDSKIAERFESDKPNQGLSAVHILVDGCSCSQSFLNEFKENYKEYSSIGKKKNYKDYFVILTSENSEDFSKHLIDVPLELRERTLFYNKEEFNAKYDVSSAPWLVAFNGKSEKLLYSGGYNTVKISDQRQTRYFQIKRI